MPFDILIKNAVMIDGTGARAMPSDIGIEGPTITAVQPRLDAEAGLAIDAAGLNVCPGFIDVHSHADFTLPSGPTADSLLHQGITTAVVGQCGFSSAPLLPDTRDAVIASQDSRLYPRPWHEWSDFSSYLAYLESLPPSLNIVPLIGHCTVRGGVIGLGDQTADTEALKHMRHQTQAALDAGAWGVSTGLAYSPGSYASTEELIRFTEPAGKKNAFYFSHLRSEDSGLLEAAAEAIHIGRATGARVQISHLKAAWPANWSLLDDALALIDRAKSEGLDIAADVYPYTAASQRLLSLLPLWCQAGGPDQTLSRLNNPSTRRDIKASMTKESPGRFVDWQRVVVTGSVSRPECAGRTVAELAAESRKSPFDWVCAALLDIGLDMMIVMFVSSEDNLKKLLARPDIMIGTDAAGVARQELLKQAAPHPRNYGTFPRLLGRYVRELGVFPLEAAIGKCTGLPAARLGLEKRGLVRPGYFADLALFDPETIIDKADFKRPHQYPAGLPWVIVNGQITIENSRHGNIRNGRVLRRPV